MYRALALISVLLLIIITIATGIHEELGDNQNSEISQINPQLAVGSGSAPTKQAKVLSRMPLYFEHNQGQTDRTVKFLSRGNNYTLFLTSIEAVLSLKTVDSKPDFPKPRTIHIKLADANRPTAIEGLNPLPTRVNYFIGKDATKWRTKVPTFSRVAYREVYPGIDMIYYGSQGQLEFDFLISPGADPEQIAIQYEGVDRTEVTESGELILHIAGGQILQHPPTIYQQINGARHPVDGYYIFKGEHRIGFQLAQYAANYPIVIDPVLEFSSYLGGSANDRATDVAVDGNGNVYVCGYTLSGDFPTTSGAFDETYNLGYDAFVVKVDTASGTLSYATYLGGSGDDRGLSIDVQSAGLTGLAFITGRAWSSDFPTTSGAYQTTPSPAGDAFVARLNGNGSSLLYSTYLGANGAEEGRGIAVDDQGSAHVAGWTGSTDFPVTASAYQQIAGGLGDAFLARLSSSGNQLSYATYLGGNGVDEANGIAVDVNNRSYITGVTYAGDFPTTGGAFQENKPGGQFDAESFAASISSSANYVTYLGGSSDEVGYDIAVNSTGNAYITGRTASSDFPTANAFQNNLNGTEDGFVAKFNSGGSSLVFSTYLGGSSGDAGRGISVDSQNRAYVTGYTGSGNFPTQNEIQTNPGGGSDAFITRFDNVGTSLEFSSYFGGSANDSATGITIDADGNFYFTGFTLSGNFPTISPFQPNSAGGSDAFVAWIGSDTQPITDCNNNGIPDSLDIVNGTSLDCNMNGVPDECDIASGTSGDCNNNGIPDECDIASGTSNDCNNDGIPDECQLTGNDCNNNGIPDDCDIAGGMSNDCNNDSIPDECQLVGNDCNNNGIPDDCEGPDCNENDILDECEALLNPIPIDTNFSINVIPNHDHSSEPVCDNHSAAISADGRIIAFESSAGNLVPGDTNKVSDIFVYDVQTGTIERVSVSSSGQEANAASTSPSISDDGQLVAFVSGANNLVPNDSNGLVDVFVHNRQTGITERVNVSSNGEEANGGMIAVPMISGDGRYVMFPSLATNLIPNDPTLNEEVFVRDLQNGLTVRPVAFNSNTFEIITSISQTGRFLTFSLTDQPELDSLDTNFDWDIYIHDRDPDENGVFDEGNGITELISVSDSGQIGNSTSFSQPYASADGRYVVFGSSASNLVPNDVNGFPDLFVHDRLTGMKEIVSVSTSGQQANASTSAFFGKYMSDDGRYVTFVTTADNLVSGDTNGEADIFLRDRHTGTTARINLSSSGAQANSYSSEPALNTNGHYVAFSSAADNLVPNDTDNVHNIFLVPLDHVTSIKANDTQMSIPNHLQLQQNYPNPFNPVTTITFAIPPALNGQRAVVRVFDLLGREVTTLFKGKVHPGIYELKWEGTDAGGKRVAGGIYFYRIIVGRQAQTRKLLLLK